LASQLDGFFDFIVTSSYMDLLQEYSTASTQIQHGRRLTSVHVANSEPGTVTPAGRQVTDAQIQTALQGWIATNTVSATTANTLYFIFLPPDVVSLAFGSQSCAAGGFCGYHEHIGNVYYAVIPYANCPGCVFSGQFLDTLTEVSSHELAEAITDPALNAWWDPVTGPGDEIGDICNRQTVRLGGFVVQTEWSNAQAACVFAPSAVAKLQTNWVAAWGQNRLDIFGLGTDGAMYHKAWDGSAWRPSPLDWERLGGVFTSPPAVVSWGQNRLDIFGLGTDGAMYHKAWDGSAWRPSPLDWERLGGVFTSPPAVAAWGQNRLDIFGLGTDGAMYHKA
jgi:hypothetical protein